MTSINRTDRRVVVESVEPSVDCGRFPAKSVLGDPVEVTANVFADGHDSISAVLQFRHVSARRWTEQPMEFLGNDAWLSTFTPDKLGMWEFRVDGWVDHFATWVRGLEKKEAAGVVTELDLAAGAALLEAGAARVKGSPAARLGAEASKLGDEGTSIGYRVELALSDGLAALMAEAPDRRRSTGTDNAHRLVADRVRSVYSSWYELFPRSWALQPGAHGTFSDVEAQLDYVADLGFDVLYLPPIHPIGLSHRKGPNNSLQPSPDDPGVPWAIGSKDGGHTAIHPELGTLEDFISLVSAAREKGIEVALDIALQASPDHPWVESHPEWFKKRPDGTIQYAENPPKKYQDIYPIDFETSDPVGLWNGLREVFDYWIEHGIRIFRVDNPHTKAFAFWEWLISEIRSEHPDVILLAEAFTRPAVMHRLAKAGFNQSYTYFAWRNTKHELTQYMHDLHEVRHFFRPNFWPNTPDILTEYLQTGTRAAFISRLVLAATMSASYGILGPAFELMEHQSLRPGTEDYLDSEKYEIRVWDRTREDSLAPIIQRVNRARADHQALQRNDGLTFHVVDNEMILCFSKRAGTDTILVVVNLDPHHSQTGWTHLDLDALGVDPEHPFQMHDLITDRRYSWGGATNFVQLDVAGIPAHIFHVRNPSRSERDFDYFT